MKRGRWCVYDINHMYEQRIKNRSESDLCSWVSLGGSFRVRNRGRVRLRLRLRLGPGTQLDPTCYLVTYIVKFFDHQLQNNALILQVHDRSHCLFSGLHQRRPKYHTKITGRHEVLVCMCCNAEEFKAIGPTWSEFACPANQHPESTIRKNKAHKPLCT